jgi:hypothetical protein
MIGLTNAIDKFNGVNYIQYIESTGTQHIDTGVIVTGATGFELDFEYYEGGRILGVVDGSFTGGFVLYGSANMYYNGISGSNGVDLGDFGVGERKKITLKNNVVTKLDGTTHTFPSATFSSNGTLIIFGLRYNGNVEENTRASMKLYNFKIYNGDTLIRNFRACKDENGVYCLYDKVEKKYYYNGGTGSFSGSNS